MFIISGKIICNLHFGDDIDLIESNFNNLKSKSINCLETDSTDDDVNSYMIILSRF